MFKTVRVGEAIEQRVTRRILEGAIPVTATGTIDEDAIKKLWEAEVKEEVDYVNRLSGGRIVVGMGTLTEATKPTPEQEKAQRKAEKKALRETSSRWDIKTPQGLRVLNEGRAAFDPAYNSRNKEAQVAEVAR